MKSYLAILTAIGTAAVLIPQAYAGGDPLAGEKAFKARCLGCHEHGRDRNALGASLVGVIGRKAGTLPGATFSRALTDSNITWNEASLDQYLASPSKMVAWTLMTTDAIAVAREREDIIAYLKTLR